MHNKRLINISTQFDNPWENPSSKEDKNKRQNDPISREIEDIIKKGQEKIIEILGVKKNIGGNNMKDKHNQNINPSYNLFAAILLLVALLVWLSTGFYTIDTDEEGVIMRFGKYNRTATPGLNYKLPTPIEVVDKVSVTRIHKELVGLQYNQSANITSDQNDADISNPKESQMVTGDENIIDMHFFVQWYIKDAKNYLFNIKDDLGDNTIRITAESVMRQVVGLVKISEALSEQRQEIEQKAKIMLQQILDSYNSGIEVVNLGILYSYVAPEVRDAYRDIQSAKADKEREINQAYAYKNDIIPRARGEAQTIIAEAEAYRESVVSKATGESERFNSVLSQYKKAKDITRKRMYIETMEQILKDMNKVIVDKSLGKNSIPLLSISDLAKQIKKD